MQLEINEDQKEILSMILHEKEYQLKKYFEHVSSKELFTLKKATGEMLESISNLIDEIGRDYSWERTSIANPEYEELLENLRQVEALLRKVK